MKGRHKWRVVLLGALVMTVLFLAGGILAATMGHKSLADRYFAPMMLIFFGMSIIVGTYYNARYINWAKDNVRGYCSPEYRPVAYLAALVTGAVGGVAIIAGGVILLLLRA